MSGKDLRTRPIGFLSEGPKIPGVRDQQMAIEWVHRNIEYFGGDKDRITLFGCSAGGRSAGAQLMSPYNEGKVFGAIGQSGGASADLMWDFHAEENRNQVFKSLGCENQATRLLCLRSKSVRQVLNRAF